MNNVLIIDDDKELCALMKKCVEKEKLSAQVANGGIEGLEPDQEHPFYILTVRGVGYRFNKEA